jgi:hypothetical protein
MEKLFMFHETKENIMFKKTLLALAVAGVSVSANAATIYTSSTDAVDKTAATNALIAGGETKYLGGDNAFGGANDDCAAIATKIGATVDLDGNTAANKQLDTATYAATTNGLQTKNLVKYTGAAACTVTYAPTFSSTAAKDGIEYSALKAIEVKPTLVAGIGGYRAEDTITIEIAGAKIDTTATTAPALVVAGNDGVLGGGTAANMKFDILDIDENKVRFIVKPNDPAAHTVAGSARLLLTKVFIDSDGLSNETEVSVSSFGTNTSGTVFDPSKPAVVTTLTPQYKAEVTSKYDALIDVAQDRQTFDSGDNDTLSFTVTKQTTGLELVPASVSYVVTGDFSWFNNKAVDTNEDGKYSSSEIGAWVTATHGSTFAVNSDLDKLTITGATAAPTGAKTINIKVPGYDDGKLENPVIPVQSFTVAVDVVSDKSVGGKAGTMTATTATDAGAWELNGSVIYVPYVPFGPNTQPILRHTNKGMRTGDITVRYMVEGEHTEWQPLSAANVADAKPGVRNMLSLVTDALKGEGYDATKSGFKVALEIVTNVPARDVFVYGGAKVSAEGQDRIHLGTLKDND